MLIMDFLNGDSRMKANPGFIEGNVGSCTGAQICSLAMIETKSTTKWTECSDVLLDRHFLETHMPHIHIPSVIMCCPMLSLFFAAQTAVDKCRRPTLVS